MRKKSAQTVLIDLTESKGHDESGESLPAGKDGSLEVALMFYFCMLTYTLTAVGARRTVNLFVRIYHLKNEDC